MEYRDGDFTAGGSRIFDHRGQPRQPMDGPSVDPAYIDAVTAHIERTVGPTDGMLFHEIVSPYVHLDIIGVPPAGSRTWTTLVTCGMGSRAMNTPREFRSRSRIELALCLPKNWPPLTLSNGEAAGRMGPGAWIIAYLQDLARTPFEFGTWFGQGHTIPNGDPPEPFDDQSRLVCALIDTPRRIRNPEFQQLAVPDGGTVYFYSVYFLTAEEMQYKLQHSMDKLWKKLASRKVDELLRLKRSSACSGGLWERFFG